MSNDTEPKVEYQHEASPWQDAELMETLYVDELYSTTDIAELFDCSQSTVSKWLKKHDIPIRNLGDSISIAHGNNPNYVYMYMHDPGYIYWENRDQKVAVHRLIAVAKYGFDAVKGMQVHHKNGLSWDNRASNIELIAPEDHKREHLKIDGVDRIRVAELYEHGDISIRDLADELDFEISSGTVRNIHKEFYGEGS